MTRPAASRTVLLVCVLAATSGCALHSVGARSGTAPPPGGETIRDRSFPLALEALQRDLLAGERDSAAAVVARARAEAASGDSGAIARRAVLEAEYEVVRFRPVPDSTQALVAAAPRLLAALGGDNREDVALACLVHARLMGAGSHASEGVAWARRGAALARHVLADSSLALAGCLNRAAQAYLAAGLRDSAEALYLTSIAMAQARPDSVTADPLASALQRLAIIRSTQARYGEGLALIHRCIALRERAPGPRGGLGAALSNLALIENDMADLDHARLDIDRAVRLLTDAYGEQDGRLQAARGILGGIARASGDPFTARRAHELGLEFWRQAFGPEDVNVAIVETNIGNALRDAGDLEGARRRYEHVLHTFEARGDTLFLQYHDALHQYSDVLYLLGDLEPAEAAARHTLALRRNPPPGTETRLANAEQVLALVLADRGGFGEACDLERDALAIMRTRRGEVHSETGWAWLRLGEFESLAGAGDIGRRDLGHGLEMLDAVLGPGHPETGRAYELAASIGARSGAKRQPLAWALRADSIGRECMRALVAALPEREALGYARTRPQGVSTALGLLAREHAATRGDIETVWDALIRSRGLLFDLMASRQRNSAADTTGSTRALRERLATVRARHARMFLRGPGNAPLARHVALLDSLRRAGEGMEEALAGRTSARRSPGPAAGIGYADVAAALRPGEALLAYARHVADPGWMPIPERRRAPGSYSALLVVGGGSEPVLIRLGDAGRIDELVRAWQDAVTAPSSPGTRQSYRRRATRLRAAVWDPVAAHVRNVRRLFLVADGALSTVNFGTLPADRGRFLIETAPLFVPLSVERDLVAILPAGEPAQGLLAIGNIDYDRAGEPAPRRPSVAAERAAASDCATLRTQRFAPLSETAAEIHAVVALVGAGSREVETVLEGSQASEGAFKRQAPGRRLLHLATHGFFFTAACTDAAPTRESAPALVQEENPLLRCGLVLAGANARAAAEQDEDGMLTAEEISVLDLHGVQCVVLSACETGKGKIVDGEGLFGLERAFRTAGARTVVASLWRVEDAAARAWMEEFYRAGGSAPGDAPGASRAASLRILHWQRSRGWGPDPALWGAFRATGVGRPAGAEPRRSFGHGPSSSGAARPSGSRTRS